MNCKNNRLLVKFKVEDVNFLQRVFASSKKESRAFETHKENLATYDSPVNINEKGCDDELQGLRNKLCNSYLESEGIWKRSLSLSWLKCWLLALALVMRSPRLSWEYLHFQALNQYSLLWVFHGAKKNSSYFSFASLNYNKPFHSKEVLLVILSK